MEIFDDALGDKPSQLDVLRDDVAVSAEQLVDFVVEDGDITEGGVRQNVDVAIQYIASWLRGTGAAAIYNLMEDAATAEISRSQIWQWVHSGSRTKEGHNITPEFITTIADEETDRLRSELGRDVFEEGRFAKARTLFEAVSLADEFPEFLTLPAYALLDKERVPTEEERQ